METSGLGDVGKTGGSQKSAYLTFVKKGRRHNRGTSHNITSHLQDAKRLKMQNNENTYDDSSMVQDEQPTIPAISTQNSFGILSGTDGTSETITVSGSPPLKKGGRLPPITIEKIGTKQVRELLIVGNIPQDGYHMKAIKVGVQLVVKEEEHYQI